MERARKNNPQVLLILLAAAFVVAAIWAATALAAGGSPAASGDSGGSQPAVAFVQAEDDAAPSADGLPRPRRRLGRRLGRLVRIDRIELDGLLGRRCEGAGRSDDRTGFPAARIRPTLWSIPWPRRARSLVAGCCSAASAPC